MTQKKNKSFYKWIIRTSRKNNISLYAIKDRFLLSIKENISFVDNKEISEETKNNIMI